MRLYPYQNEATAPEGTSGGVAPSAEPTAPVQTPAPIAPVIVAAAVAKPEPKVDAPAPTVEVKAEPVAVKIDAASDLAGKLAELEAARAEDAKKIAQLEAARVSDAKSLRDAKFDGLLTHVKVAPAYREFAKAQLAGVDPDSLAGKAAVDAFAAAHPAMLDIQRPGSAEPTVAAWMAEKAKANPGSAWSFIPPSALAKMAVD